MRVERVTAEVFLAWNVGQICMLNEQCHRGFSACVRTVEEATFDLVLQHEGQH